MQGTPTGAGSCSCSRAGARTGRAGRKLASIRLCKRFFRAHRRDLGSPTRCRSIYRNRPSPKRRGPPPGDRLTRRCCSSISPGIRSGPAQHSVKRAGTTGAAKGFPICPAPHGRRPRRRAIPTQFPHRPRFGYVGSIGWACRRGHGADRKAAKVHYNDDSPPRIATFKWVPELRSH